MTLFALLVAAQAANVPELPEDVPAGAAKYTVLMMGLPAGQQAVWTEAGKLRVFFQLNDRGRGPKTYATIALQDGVPVSQLVEGHDYMHSTVRETFSLQGGVASWRNNAEHGTKKLAAPAFYASLYATPLESALLVRAALARGGRIALLPDGEARVEKVFDRTAAANDRKEPVTLVSIAGLGFAPDYVWLDRNGELFAAGETWSAVIREGWEAAMPALLEAQQEAQDLRARQQARRLAHRPRGALVFHDVSVFDAELLRTVPHQDVTIEGNRIVRVLPSAAPQPGAEVIEGAGKTLLPGLWDMHAHVAATDGILNLACGVTTVRDLANDTDELLARRKRIEEGSELGTRIVMAGFMDGPGPYQGPTKVLVADEKTGRDWVDKYASLGMVQIKLYSSLKPELVAPIADEAHKKGLRVSGHIPAGLVASEAVKLGYDEIQHVNFLVLNFMPDVKETRTPARFTEPGKRAADLDLGSGEVRAFVELLRDRHRGRWPCLPGTRRDTGPRGRRCSRSSTRCTPRAFPSRPGRTTWPASPSTASSSSTSRPGSPRRRSCGSLRWAPRASWGSSATWARSGRESSPTSS